MDPVSMGRFLFSDIILLTKSFVPQAVTNGTAVAPNVERNVDYGTMKIDKKAFNGITGLMQTGLRNIFRLAHHSLNPPP